ncbi:RNA polymerase sigma factor [Niabella aquatica]
MFTEPDLNAHTHFRYFKMGKEEGFTFFYNSYCSPLSRFARRYIKNGAAIEEIVHDAFINTWNLRHLIRCPAHLYCVLQLHLKQGCLSYRQKQIKERLVYRNDIDEAFADKFSENKLYNNDKEQLHLLYKALSLLPPKKRNIVTLYFRRGLSCKAIALHYNVSSQRIAKQLNDSIYFLKSLTRKKRKADVGKVVLTMKI